MKATVIGAVLCITASSCLPATLATNDTKASFDNGVFALPELSNEKDAYLITITPESSEKKPQKLSLPPGSNGIRFNIKALPEGSWTWSYKISAALPGVVKLQGPTETLLSPSDIPLTGKYTLGWTPVEGAKKYSISGSTRTKDRPSDDPEWAKLNGSCTKFACERGGVGVYFVDIKPGTEMKWSVSALDEDDVVIAKSEEAHLAVDNTIVQGAKSKGFSLQRSDTLSKATATMPATLSYLTTQKEGKPRTSAYQSEFALIYDSQSEWKGFFPRVSLEGHLTSSGDQKANDALRFRVGAYKHFLGVKAAEGSELVTNLKYETERKTGTKKGLVELGFTPLYGVLGTYYPIGAGERDIAGNFRKAPWLSIAPTITLGTELGKTIDVGSSEEKKDSVLRLKTIARLDIELGALSQVLGTRGVNGYLEGSYWHLPREDVTKNYRLGKAGLSFGLTDYLSFDVSYSVGRDSPTFLFNRSGTAGFGLKF